MDRICRIPPCHLPNSTWPRSTGFGPLNKTSKNMLRCTPQPSRRARCRISVRRTARFTSAQSAHVRSLSEPDHVAACAAQEGTSTPTPQTLPLVSLSGPTSRRLPGRAWAASSWPPIQESSPTTAPGLDKLAVPPEAGAPPRIEEGKQNSKRSSNDMRPQCNQWLEGAKGALRQTPRDSDNPLTRPR